MPNAALGSLQAFATLGSGAGRWESAYGGCCNGGGHPAETRYIKLRVLSTYGGPYASLGEFDAFILPKGPFDQATPGARPKA